MCKKMKNLRYDLKNWSKGISRLSNLIENTNRALLEIDGLEDKRRLSIPEVNFRIILKKHLLVLLDYKRIYWKKSCTVRYFQFGDGNTTFFHTVATERFRRNSITSLRLPDDTMVHDHVGKESIMFNTYKNRLGQSDPVDIKFDLARIIKKIDGLEELTIPFT